MRQCTFCEFFILIKGQTMIERLFFRYYPSRGPKMTGMMEWGSKMIKWKLQSRILDTRDKILYLLPKKNTMQLGSSALEANFAPGADSLHVLNKNVL